MMQTLSLQERSIDELAYVADGYALHQLGIPDDQARLEPPHLHLKNGAALRLDAVPVVSRACAWWRCATATTAR